MMMMMMMCWSQQQLKAYATMIYGASMLTTNQSCGNVETAPFKSMVRHDADQELQHHILEKSWKGSLSHNAVTFYRNTFFCYR